MDEGTFTAFAPKLLQQQLAEVKELVVPARIPSLRGLDVGAVLKLAAAVVSLGVVIPILVVPQSQILAEAGDALCGERPACSHTYMQTLKTLNCDFMLCSRWRD